VTVKPGIAAAFFSAFITGAFSAAAQVPTPPEPIPVPPIPAPPQLGPAPKVVLGKPTAPPPPAIDIPAKAEFPPFVIPPQAPMTEADASDKTPPPPSGRLTGPTRMISPGDTASQIDETMFIMDPGVSDLSPQAEGKLRDVAKTLSLNPGDRLEVRVYSPSKPRNESIAHRLSLARFLAIRAFLIKNGADDNSIDGRPLISDPAELNADRVELYVER